MRRLKNRHQYISFINIKKLLIIYSTLAMSLGDWNKMNTLPKVNTMKIY